MANPSTLITFHLFPILPHDIRRYIYTFICPELGHQQVLEFTLTLRPSADPETEQHHALTPSHCTLARNTAAIRLLLSICAESRTLALRQWPDTLEFPPAWKPKPPSPRAEGWIRQLADEYDEYPVGGVVRFRKERDLVFLVPWHHSKRFWRRCGPSYLYAWDPSEFWRGSDDDDDDEEEGEADDVVEDEADLVNKAEMEDVNHSSSVTMRPLRRDPLAVFDLAGFGEHVHQLVVHTQTYGPLDYMYRRTNHQPWNALLEEFQNLKRLYLPVRAVQSKGDLARPNWRVFVSSTAVEIRRPDPDGVSFCASSWPRSYDALRRGMEEENDRLKRLGMEAKRASEHLPRFGRDYKEWVTTKVPRELMESGKKGNGEGCQILPVVLWRGLYQIKWLQEAELEVVNDDLREDAWWLLDHGGCPAGIFE